MVVARCCRWFLILFRGLDMNMRPTGPAGGRAGAGRAGAVGGARFLENLCQAKTAILGGYAARSDLQSYAPVSNSVK